jgi:hypothetical protein
MLPAMHLLAILGLAYPLDEFGHCEVEGHVLVGAVRLGPHERPWSDQGEFDPVIAGGPPGLVMACHLDFEGDRLRCKMGDFVCLFRCILAEAIRNANIASGDGNFHVRPPSPNGAARYSRR